MPKYRRESGIHARWLQSIAVVTHGTRIDFQIREKWSAARVKTICRGEADRLIFWLGTIHLARIICRLFPIDTENASWMVDSSKLFPLKCKLRWIHYLNPWNCTYLLLLLLIELFIFFIVIYSQFVSILI